MTDQVKAEKAQTREQLKATIADLSGELANARSALSATCRELDARVLQAKQTGDQVNDLKQRLALAESDNQRMRGYIARVQEDDVVREDLVQVGDPGGEHRLVPKRKATKFTAPDAYGGIDRASNGYWSNNALVERVREGSERKPPKHWVTY